MAIFDDHVILITGASRGIGAEVACRLAGMGAHVVLAARNVAGLEAVDDRIKAAGGLATLVPIDLAQHEMIDALGAAILEKFGRLDGVIGNAAVLGQVAPLSHIDPKLWQQLMDINVTANYRLIRITEALLKRSTYPRLAFVTSGATLGVMPYWSGYATSKIALEQFVLTYAREMQDTAFRVNLIDPGIVATGMRAQAFPGEDAASLMQPNDERLTDVFVNAMHPDCNAHGQRLTVSQ